MDSMGLDTERLLDQFHQWLARTEEEMSALREAASDLPDDFPASNLIEDDTERDDSNPVDRTNPSSHSSESAGGEEFSSDAVGLLSIIEAFTALRQELKMQTKSARGLDENVRASLAALESASRQFQTVQAQETQAAERAALPLVELLIGLDESLERCQRAFEILRNRVVAEGPADLIDKLKQRFQQQSAWRRWWSRGWHQQALATCREEAAGAYDRLFQSLQEGFSLAHARLREGMRQQGIQRITCVGQMIDPNRMTVVGLVDAPDAPAESVVAEVRPGYVWRERVLRFAEVQCARRPVA